MLQYVHMYLENYLTCMLGLTIRPDLFHAKG
jgi:hypothetical protein